MRLSIHAVPDELRPKMLDLLIRSIDLALQRTELRVDAVARLNGLTPPSGPAIRRDPPSWKGPSYVGQRYADCPIPYLLAVQDSLHEFARQAQDGQRWALFHQTADRCRLVRSWLRHKGHVFQERP